MAKSITTLSFEQKWHISRWLIANWDKQVIPKRMNAADVARALQADLRHLRLPLIKRGQLVGIMRDTAELKDKDFSHAPTAPINSLLHRSVATDLTERIEKLERIVSGLGDSIDALFAANTPDQPVRGDNQAPPANEWASRREPNRSNVVG